MNGWSLTYEGYDPAHEGLRETLCALGNGYFVTRAAAPESAADGVQVEMSLPFFFSSRELSVRVPVDRGMVAHFDDSSGALQVELTLDRGKE